MDSCMVTPRVHKGLCPPSPLPCLHEHAISTQVGSRPCKYGTPPRPGANHASTVPLPGWEPTMQVRYPSPDGSRPGKYPSHTHDHSTGSGCLCTLELIRRKTNEPARHGTYSRVVALPKNNFKIIIRISQVQSSAGSLIRQNRTRGY